MVAPLPIRLAVLAAALVLCSTAARAGWGMPGGDGPSAEGRTPDGAPPPAAVTEPASSLLWGLRPPDRAHVSYLFGTLHAVGIERGIPDYGLDRRMEETGRLVVETVTDWRREGLLHNALLPEGTKLYHVLRPAQYRRAVFFFRRYGGIDADVLDDYTPAHLALLAGVYLRHDGSYMDWVLRDFAQSLDIRIEGLETLHEQTAPLAALESKEQGYLLDRMLRAAHQPPPETGRLLDAYRRADIDSVALLLSALPSPAYHPAILEGRNDLLARRIDETLRYGPALVTVGAGHLAGERGLLALLREAGYDVWPIAPDAPSPDGNGLANGALSTGVPAAYGSEGPSAEPSGRPDLIGPMPPR
jgi:uncharacterized protein YbaP (TraB family)